jgi:hypothetical protein
MAWQTKGSDVPAIRKSVVAGELTPPSGPPIDVLPGGSTGMQHRNPGFWTDPAEPSRRRYWTGVSWGEQEGLPRDLRGTSQPPSPAVGPSRGATTASASRVGPVVAVAILVVAGIAFWGMTQGGDQAPAAKPQGNSVTNTKPSTTGSGAIIRSYKVEYRSGEGGNYIDVQYSTGTGYSSKIGISQGYFKESVPSLRSGDTAYMAASSHESPGTATRCEIWVDGQLESVNLTDPAGTAYCTVLLR